MVRGFFTDNQSQNSQRCNTIVFHVSGWYTIGMATSQIKQRQVQEMNDVTNAIGWDWTGIECIVCMALPGYLKKPLVVEQIIPDDWEAMRAMNLWPAAESTSMDKKEAWEKATLLERATYVAEGIMAGVSIIVGEIAEEATRPSVEYKVVEEECIVGPVNAPIATGKFYPHVYFTITAAASV